jgi:ribosomal protein S18 acetylase RimI-like enzyme
MKFRKAEIKDIPEMRSLLKELFSIEEDFSFDAEKATVALELILKNNKKAIIMLAEENNKTIGMASIQLLISTAEGGYSGLIEDVVVKKDLRGKGVGRKLLENIEKWAKENGVKRIQLLADKNNDPALDFYKKNSWDSTSMICFRKKNF